MASTNFLVFDEGKQNMMSDGDYSANTQRARGVTPGIAYPNLHNKLYYQTSVMVKAIADFMVAQGTNASDEDVEQLTADISTAFTNFVDKKTKDVYLPLSGGTLTGDLDVSGHSITANKFKGTADHSEYTNRAYTGQLSYNADTPYYTTFAKIPIADTTANCTLLFSNGANTAQDKMATYIMYLGTNKGQSPQMLVEQLTSFKSSYEPEFGYYVDGEYFCFGVKSPWYRGVSAFTVLARPGTLEIGTIKDQTDMPNGWTSVSPTTLQTATANTLMQQKIATMSLNIIENNNYWTKNIDGIITQVTEIELNGEKEIDIQFPISFTKKCLFLDVEIINPEKDTSINCIFHTIEKTVDGAKLLKVGTGSPKKIVVKVIGI